MFSGYFDYAAATPMDPRVLEAMQPFFAERFYNPSASYGPSRNVKKAIDQARIEVAQILGIRPAEIIFTAGGTEANNLAICGVMEKYPEANLIVSSIEHESVRSPAGKYDFRECPVLPDGILDFDKLADLIEDNTVLISVMLANNEIGTIQPVKKISSLIEEVRINRRKAGNNLPLYLHTDAAQATNYLPLFPRRLGVDLMSLNGGKIYGPKQIGLLFIRGGMELEPVISGGGQERNLRSGTENVPGIIGLAEALKITDSCREEESARLKQLQKQLFSKLEKNLSDLQVNGSPKHRLPNNVHLTIPGQDNERLLILLEEKGIYAAAGSACSASHEEPSHVLRSIGLDDADIRASLRITMGRHTTEEDIELLVSSLVSVLA